MQTGFAHPEEENLTPTESAKCLECLGLANQVIKGCCNHYYRSYFEDYDCQSESNTE
jgi:hypothetical protein